MMLMVSEQDDLYAVYAKFFGEDLTVKNAKTGFNEQTVEVLEQAIDENIRCNENMKSLVVGLMQESAFFAKGWLKRSLRNIAKNLKIEGVKFNGYACFVASKSRWRQAILGTTI